MRCKTRGKTPLEQLGNLGSFCFFVLCTKNTLTSYIRKLCLWIFRSFFEPISSYGHFSCNVLVARQRKRTVVALFILTNPTLLKPILNSNQCVPLKGWVYIQRVMVSVWAGYHHGKTHSNWNQAWLVRIEEDELVPGTLFFYLKSDVVQRSFVIVPSTYAIRSRIQRLET